MIANGDMKRFDNYLQRALRKDEYDDWTENYINYAFLKHKIRYFLERRQAWKNRGDIEYSTDLMPSDNDNYSHEISWQEALQKLAWIEREEFIIAVSEELQRCQNFVDKQYATLEESLESLDGDDNAIDEIAAETLETFHFIVTSICSLRQILIRFNSFRRVFDSPTLSESDIPQARKLFKLESLRHMEAAITHHKKSKQMHHELSQFSQQYYQFRCILDSSLQCVERGGGDNFVVKDRMLSSGRQFLIKGSSKLGLILEPSFLDQSTRHLKQEMRTLAQWRDTKVLASKPKSLHPSNVWPLVLNLISCFLFMMNNYIIEPSSAYYANALGTSDAMSGILIGSSALFALISAVGYSFWTNTSYQQPILFSGFLMIIGNFVYSNAYSYRSIEMCLIGRSICGLGAPRVINRRYVADATPFSLRTASSAAFALMTALGSALGPGMAIILDQFNFEFKVPLLGKQYFNGMTGPGYFMATVWSIYTLVVALTFREPNRSGLEELRKREEDFQTVWSEDDNLDDDDDSVETGRFKSTVQDIEELSPNSPSYCLKHMTKGAALCMVIIFMKRVALESIVGSTSVITKNRFKWSITKVGTLHLVNGLIIIPISLLSGWISQFYEDRLMALMLLGIAVLGMFVLVDVTDLLDHSNETYNADSRFAVGPFRYIVGCLIAFSGIEACESFVASLISKVVPSALAVGTFNSGLLVTLVGTSGRATGDFFITAMGLISIRNLLNLLVIPGIGLMIISSILVHRNYSILAV